jgi:hypothetical protein
MPNSAPWDPSTMPLSRPRGVPLSRPRGICETLVGMIYRMAAERERRASLISSELDGAMSCRARAVPHVEGPSRTRMTSGA